MESTAHFYRLQFYFVADKHLLFFLATLLNLFSRVKNAPLQFYLHSGDRGCFSL